MRALTCWPTSRPSRPRRRRRRSACRPKTSGVRTRRLPPSKSPCFREIEPMHVATPPAPRPPSTAHLALPFFDDAHRALAEGLVPWAAAQAVDETDDRAACRDWVKRLGAGGWLRYCGPAAHGELIAAFALSEPEAGSDVGAMQTIAASTDSTSATGTFCLNGTKTWISNGGIADFYCVFAKTNPSGGTRGISAFIVEANTPGLGASRHIHVMAPHPLATLQFTNCNVPATALLGDENGGFKLAMRTLDIFRASVAAAALGMARRALAEAVHHARQRRMFGQTLADFQLTQAKIGEMAALVDSAALLTYRAASLRDTRQARVTAEAAPAKITPTENAQRVIDMALQLHGGRGVELGSKVESLYRDIRSLRIYEGATEVQQLIIGKAVLQE